MPTLFCRTSGKMQRQPLSTMAELGFVTTHSMEPQLARHECARLGQPSGYSEIRGYIVARQENYFVHYKQKNVIIGVQIVERPRGTVKLKSYKTCNSVTSCSISSFIPNMNAIDITFHFLYSSLICYQRPQSVKPKYTVISPDYI